MSSATGAVACGHPATAAAAIEILEEGGNAFDAAIAAQFTACVAEPVLTSLGGGGFLLAGQRGKTPRLFDFFAHTPLARPGSSEALRPIEADFGTATQTFHIGAGSVATPGTVAGMFHTHQALGTLPMTRLLEPAIRAAREGLVINDFQGYIFDVVRPIYTACPPFDRAHTDQLLQQPELAESMAALATEGAGLFYEGELGRRLIDLCRAGGGHLSSADLSDYQVIERQPLAFEYRGARIFTNPAPSAGGVLIRHSLGHLEPKAADALAMVDAFVATASVRDSLVAAADQVTRGTTHISVIDRNGNVAAMTLSNGEGSGCLVPGTGIMSNNMLGEEDINPLGIDRWTPDRRLGSMMAPTLILDGGSQFALGSGGSNRIRSALTQVIVHLLHHRTEPAAAVHAPRLHLEGRLLSIEPGFDAAVVAHARDAAIEVQPWQAQNLFFGGVHLVAHHPDGHFDAVGDPRRGGVGQIASGDPR